MTFTSAHSTFTQLPVLRPIPYFYRNISISKALALGFLKPNVNVSMIFRWFT